ncbi:MAG: phenylalanine--tRNA ligase subunit beta [Patescibacteria group bacterium]|nr:phenylalanine--tRNA ligase subunit beta [Patescibacteria group bacterium]
MLVSRNWLNEYCAIPKSLSDKDLALKLSLTVVEVEGWQEEGKNLDKVVVGKILKVSKHPNADKLKICVVDVGTEKLSIVCGGANVAEGMLVAVARVGARVRWHGEGELQELAPAKIRGIESRGMICAAEELGLSEKLNPEHGILDITGTRAKPGAPFARALGLTDTIFEVDNKSLTHRPDLWGHYGMARELSAIYGGKLKPVDLQKIKSPKKGTAKKLKVKILDSALCPRYMGLVIDNIKIAASPVVLQKRLAALNVRPINNIVDATNYILLELGQPLHAFDYSLIPGGEIMVRRAARGEKITTIDEIPRNLDSEMLVIANAKGPVAVAGIMGGRDSGISGATKTIVIESANFEPYSIRKTSTRLGLRTESSIRFEKSLDPNLAETAILRAAKLIMEMCPEARIASPLVDAAKFSLKQGPIKLSLKSFESKVGLKLPRARVASILKSLGFVSAGAGDILNVKIPSWRATKDIVIAEDLIEEVLRIHGYDKVKSRLPKFEITPPPQSPLPVFEHRVRDILAGLGASEVYNYSFISERDLSRLGIDDGCIKIKNPISREEALLRPNMLPNLIKNISSNQHSFPDIMVFEIGSVYLNKPSDIIADPKKKTYLPEEKRRLAAAVMNQGGRDPFEQARDLAANFFYAVGIDCKFKPVASPKPYEHPARTAYIFAGEKLVGKVFELHPAKAKEFGVNERVGYLEVELEPLPELIVGRNVKFYPLARFPSVRRDIALVCSEGLLYNELEAAIRGASSLVAGIELFDTYRGEKIPQGTKSLALHLELRHSERTLEAPEIDREISKILSSLAAKKISLRK